MLESNSGSSSSNSKKCCERETNKCKWFLTHLLEVIKMQIEFHIWKCGRAERPNWTKPNRTKQNKKRTTTNSQAINMRFRYYWTNGCMFADPGKWNEYLVKHNLNTRKKTINIHTWAATAITRKWNKRDREKN